MYKLAVYNTTSVSSFLVIGRLHLQAPLPFSWLKPTNMPTQMAAVAVCISIRQMIDGTLPPLYGA